MKYRIFLENRAFPDLNEVPEPGKTQIRERLSRLKDGFQPDLDIRKLKGYKNTYRLRVRDWRIIFELLPD